MLTYQHYNYLQAYHPANWGILKINIRIWHPRPANPGWQPDAHSPVDLLHTSLASLQLHTHSQSTPKVPSAHSVTNNNTCSIHGKVSDTNGRMCINGDLSMRTHVQRTTSCCFAALRQLRQIRRLVSTSRSSHWQLPSSTNGWTMATVHWLASHRTWYAGCSQHWTLQHG